MKTYLLTVILMFTLTAAVSADTIRAKVNGMVCGFCATAIEKTFRKQPEVSGVNVDLNEKLVTVTMKSGHNIDDAKFKKLMANTGYSVVSIDHAK